MAFISRAWRCRQAAASVLQKRSARLTFIAVVLAWMLTPLASMTRGERTPLVPVPDHGDLIDRDAYEYPGDLMDEPVIIPADKEDGEP